MKNKEKIIKVIYIIVQIAVIMISFLAIYRINHFTHEYHDEFVYSSIYGTKERIQNLGDVLYSSKNLYMLHNGRLITHIVMMIFLLCNKMVRDIFNSIFFILLIYLLIRFINKNEKSNIYKITTTILLLPMLWITIPSFGETAIWFAGSVNYLWTTCFLIIYINIINKLFYEEKELSKKKTMLLSIFSFVIASLHEATGIISIAYTFFVLAYLTLKNKKINKNILIIFLVACLGFGSVVISPGSNIRKMAEIQTMDNVPTILQKIDTIKIRLIETIKLNKFMSASILVTLVYVLYKFIRKFKDTLKDKNIFEFLFYLIVGVLVFIGMIASPSFLPRVTFTSYIIFIIAFFKGLSLLKVDYAKIALVLIMIVYFAIPAYKSFRETNTLVQIQNEAWKIRDEYIESEIAKGNKNIYVKPLNVILNDHMYGGDLSTSISYNHNGSMSVAYGIDTIRMEANYYLDLKIKDINKENTNSIRLNSNNYIENKKFYLLDKEIYEKMAPYKKYKNSYEGGEIVLYFAPENIENLNIEFLEKQIITIEEIKIYNKNQTFEQLKGKEILNKFNLENINVLEQNEEFIKLQINENNSKLILGD